jgi:hypothetical protein
MSRLDWSKTKLPNPDPARVIAVPEGGIPDGFEFVPRRVAIVDYFRNFPGQPKSIADRLYVVERTGRSDANGFIHETAMLVLKEAQMGAHIRTAGRLVAAMPETFRRGLLIAWFGAFAPIGINPKHFTTRVRQQDEKRYRAFDLARASRIPFYRLEFKGRGKLVVPE